MSTLFIADLHLSDQSVEIYRRFKQFIIEKAPQADTLYILGDLFEYYLGDDAITGVIEKVCEDLRILHDKHGVDCYFMHGNRDFLIADDFAKKAMLTIIDDPQVVEIDDSKIILCHADALCTDDKDYQKLREQFRSKKWQQWFLSLSIKERIDFANHARVASKKHTSQSSDEIMDVNQKTVVELFAQFNTLFMIHGHTHRPAFHQFKIGQQNYHRMVVGDWHYQSSYIELKNNQFHLLSW